MSAAEPPRRATTRTSHTPRGTAPRAPRTGRREKWPDARATIGNSRAHSMAMSQTRGRGRTSSMPAPSGRQRVEHGTHTIDLRGLVGVDVGGELEDQVVLGRAVSTEQFLYHGDGALVVHDHVLEEKPVELGHPDTIELRH